MLLRGDKATMGLGLLLKSSIRSFYGLYKLKKGGSRVLESLDKGPFGVRYFKLRRTRVGKREPGLGFRVQDLWEVLERAAGFLT